MACRALGLREAFGPLALLGALLAASPEAGPVLVAAASPLAALPATHPLADAAATDASSGPGVARAFL